MNTNDTVAVATGNWRRRATATVTHPYVALVLILLVGAGLRLYKLDGYDFWHDEMVTVFAARPAPAEIYAWTGINSVHPPLYYMLLHVWNRLFGEALVTMRLFSVVQSIVCIPLIFLLGRDLAGWRVGLAAASLMALAPFQVFHSQQARMYPLLTLLVLLATWSFWRAWRSGNWRWWVLLGLTAVTGFYSHVYFAFSLLGLNLWACFDSWHQRRIDRRRWAGLLISQSMAVLVFLPFLPLMFGLTQSVIESFWIGSDSALLGPLHLFSLTTFGTYRMGSQPLWWTFLLILPACAAIILGTVLSLRTAAQAPTERSNWLLLHFGVWTPLFTATFLSLTVKPILLDRSLIGISGPLFVLIAWVFVRYSDNRGIRLLALGYVAACLATLALIYPDVRSPAELRRLADYLASNAQPGDAIVYADWKAFDYGAYFYPEQPDVCVLAPTSGDTTLARQRLTFMDWRAPHCITTARELVPAYERIWLVLTPYVTDEDGRIATNRDWLHENFTEVNQETFGNAFIELYVADPR